MIPIYRRKYFMITIKLALLVFLILGGSFILYKGNLVARAAVLLLALSFFVFRIWRYRHRNSSKYDDIGYWSGLDDFELGLDLHCFDDLNLDLDDGDEFDLLSHDYFDRRRY